MLNVENITLHFGGLTVSDNINMKVRNGQITALIGPNGAGKTTLFNQIAGIYTPESGQIMLDGENITGLKPYDVCAKGITRTYQTIKLFNKMSALDNVLVGLHTKYTSGFFSDILHTKKMRSEEEENRNKAEETLKMIGLYQYRDFPAQSLSYGQQRLLEIGRAVAPKPKLLLLDEPAAGMNTVEKVELRGLIRKIVEMGSDILIVEHDMSLIMHLADYIYVINSGRNLAEGTPGEISVNKDVITAYLGENDDE